LADTDRSLRVSSDRLRAQAAGSLSGQACPLEHKTEIEAGNAAVVVTTANNGSACTINGTFTQLGRMGQVQGTYSCSSGEAGTAVRFEMNNAPFMFTARMQSQSSNFGCTSSGELAGVIPR